MKTQYSIGYDKNGNGRSTKTLRRMLESRLKKEPALAVQFSDNSPQRRRNWDEIIELEYLLNCTNG